jgi:hypothetical protein
MGSLLETIDRTLTNIGREPRDLLIETIDAFSTLELSDEEQVCAIASALASCALSSHRRHVAKYLEAVRVWALELAGEVSPAPPKLRAQPVPRRVAAAADLLGDGAEQLIEAMRDAGIGLQDRLVAELTLFTRLLGRQDANTINIVVQCIGDAISVAEFRAGDIISVPLRDMPTDRFVSLEDMVPRGTA